MVPIAALFYCGAAVGCRNRKMVPIGVLFYCGTLGAIENGALQLKRFYTVPFFSLFFWFSKKCN